MKQCPVCEKTFEDNMRFCQADGTPLVDKSEPVDPYKTMVASKADIAAAMPPTAPDPAQASTPEPCVPEPAVPAPLENELLEIPAAADPNKTQFVSEEELRAEMAAHEAEEQVIDVPPAAEPEPPKFVAPVLDTPPASDIGGAPPPSPFSSPSDTAESGPANFPTTPPIPSPFSSPVPETPSTPQFTEPPASNEPAYDPFTQPEPPQAAPVAQADFNPPAALESNMQNPQSFSPPPAAGGQNSTLAIVSMVLGILGLTICCGSFIISLAAVITGFMARGKANSDAASYGGAGMALAGIITGALGLIGGVILWIVYVFYFAAIMANMPR